MSRRWGLFEPGPEPPSEHRIRVAAGSTSGQLTRSIIRGSLRYALPGGLLLMVSHAAGMLIPVVLGELVEQVVSPVAEGVPAAQALATLLTAVGLLALLYLLRSLGFRFGGRIGWLGVQRAQFELSQQVLTRAMDVRGVSGPERPAGSLLSLASLDVRRCCAGIYLMIYPPGEVLGLLIAVVVLGTVHPLLGGGALMVLPLIVWGMHRLTTPLRRRAAAEQAAIADTAGYAAEFLRGYRTLCGLHAEREAVHRYTRQSRSALERTLAAKRAQAAFQGLSAGVGQLTAVGVVLGAVVLAVNGGITSADLVTASAVGVMLIMPVNSLTGMLGQMLATSHSASERILDFLNAPHAETSGGEAEVPRRNNGIPELSLRTPTLELHAGEFVTLSLSHRVQRSLEEILSLRELPSCSGDVLFRGRPLSELDPVRLRETLLVLPRAAVGIFSGSIETNVLAGQRGQEWGPDGERAAEALVWAGLTPDELPEGVGTDAGEAGAALSGGQRQRVTLARALVDDPEILVLIQPTSSIDAVTEQLVAESLRKRRRHRTTLVITDSVAFHASSDRHLDLRGAP